MTVIFDCRRMKDCASTHRYLASKPGFPSGYGKNLDALYDVLTSYCDVTLCVRYTGCLEKNLGDYGKNIKQVLLDAAEANPRLVLELYD